jgi:hypothetical protein
MHARVLAGFATALLVVIPLAGCGGDKKSNRDAAYKAPDTGAAVAQDAEAKSAARNAASYVESCFADSGDYSQCGDKALTDAQVEVGTAPGQVHVTGGTATGYKIEAHSKSGAVYTVAKTAGGLKRTCTGGSCKGGRW